MIMGIAGGAIFPLLMGVASDMVGAQWGAVLVVAALVAYLFVLSSFLKSKYDTIQEF
jgi:fucose permease